MSPVYLLTSALGVFGVAALAADEIQFRSVAVPPSETFQLRPISEEPREGYLPVLTHRLAGQERVAYVSGTIIASGSDVLGSSVMNNCLDDSDHYQAGITVYFRPESQERIRAATAEHMDQLVGVFSDGTLVFKARIRGVFFRAMQVCPPRANMTDVTALATHIAGLDMPNTSLERTRER